MTMDAKGVCIIGGSIVIASVVIALAITLRPAIGRFQMGSVPGHAYVIDTATGQVWEDFAIPNQGHSDDDFKRPKPR